MSACVVAVSQLSAQTHRIGHQSREAESLCSDSERGVAVLPRGSLDEGAQRTSVLAKQLPWSGDSQGVHV